MKTRKKGIIFFAVVAGIMLSSAITLAVNPAQWLDDSSDFDEMTQEDLDAFDLDALGLELGYSGDELSQFCSANELAGSNEHVKEYKIPTACTQPLAITVDHNGIVWFAQTNTGKVAKFEPLTETFTEYDNSVWENVEKIFIVSAIENNVEPTKLRSMMWGIDYFPDGSIWFTDEATDAIWKFSIDDESYNRISYSQTDEGKSSLPQKLVIEGSKIIINDFTGGRLSFLDYAQDEQGLLHYTISISYSKSKSCKRKDLYDMASVEGWNETDFNKIWEDTSKWMDTAIKYLESTNDDGFGVESAKSIPYESMLPILASLIREMKINFEPTENYCYEKIQKWYWVSIFGKRFSDSVDAKKTSDYKDMVAWFENDDKIPRFITTFEAQFKAMILDDETKGAIYDGMFSILTKKGAQDFEIRVITGEKKPDMDHVFPQSHLKGVREKNSILNMTWLTAETNREKKRDRMPSEYIKQVMEDEYNNDKTKLLDVLSRHLINEEGLDALFEDNFEEFIRSREKEMQKEIAIRTGINYTDEIEREYDISSEKNYGNAVAIRNVLQDCKKEFIWCSPYFSIGDQDNIFGIRKFLNVKKIRLLTSVIYGNKRLKHAFKDFKDDMKEQFEIECEMRVSTDILKEQHMRFLVDPYKCWKMVDNTTAKVAKSDLILEVPKGKNEKKKREEVEKWWNNSYDILEDWAEIEPLIEEYEKKQEERRKSGN